MSVAVLGSGAFGTSLAIALSRDGAAVTLWGRDASAVAAMNETRRSSPRLPGHDLPDTLTVTSEISDVMAPLCLLAVPAQLLVGFLMALPIAPETLVACCKGIDVETGFGPAHTIETTCPTSKAAMLTGPSFAEDIACGLPTALVLAAREDALGATIQASLSRPALRIYRTTDVTGAEIGGALKNVIALAAGMTLGAGLGDSARASVIARGFAEMSRYASAKGASLETLHGLSGLGDLVLTCTSEKSRNFATGLALGRRETPGARTVEGLATAKAVSADANAMGLELPLIKTVAEVVAGQLDISDAIAALLARPVGKE